MSGTALIFGISGQDGAYLARLLLERDQPEDFVIATGKMHSLKEFLDEAAAWNPDIALMDLNLPDGQVMDVLSDPTGSRPGFKHWRSPKYPEDSHEPRSHRWPRLQE